MLSLPSLPRPRCRYASSTVHRTPWSVSAAATGMPWSHLFDNGGGKMDDVTVVCALVVEEPPLF